MGPPRLNPYSFQRMVGVLEGWANLFSALAASFSIYS